MLKGLKGILRVEKKTPTKNIKTYETTEFTVKVRI
jgi:hypothetical protein